MARWWQVPAKRTTREVKARVATQSLNFVHPRVVLGVFGDNFDRIFWAEFLYNEGTQNEKVRTLTNPSPKQP